MRELRFNKISLSISLPLIFLSLSLSLCICYYLQGFYAASIIFYLKEMIHENYMERIEDQ